MALNPRPAAYADVHAYSQYWMFPYGYKEAKCQRKFVTLSMKFIERDSSMAISQPSSTLHLVPLLIGLMIQLIFLAHMLQNSEIKVDMVSSSQKIKSNLLKKKCMRLSQLWETKLWQDVVIPNKSWNISSNVHPSNR